MSEQVRIPAWVKDLKSFRRWARSDDFPEQGWFSHLNGELWVDLSMERLIHNQIKTTYTIVVGGMVVAENVGRYLSDRMLLTNLDALLSTEPDGMYCSYESLEKGRVHFKEGDDTLEILGTPDMVLEIVSKTLVQKDTVILPDLYWQAEIPEYWLVDPRAEPVQFDILRYTSRKYVAARKQEGWVKSSVFGKAFRLSRRRGVSEFSLEIR